MWKQLRTSENLGTARGTSWELRQFEQQFGGPHAPLFSLHVEQGKSGFVFPDRDFAAIAERVDQFAANLPALARMGRHGRQVIAERFSPAAYERRLVQVIRDRFGETGP